MTLELGAPRRIPTHTVYVSFWPDGRQFVSCACPIGADHPPVGRIEVVHEEDADE